MKRKLISLLTAGAVSSVALGTAFADSHGDDKAEVQAFLGAQQSITAAISAAESASSGTAIAAEFKENNGAGVFEVDIIANGKRVSVKIDAASGKVLKTEDEGDVSKAEKDDITDAAQLGAPLAQLIATAEKSGNGKVMSIGADNKNGQGVAIEVELANADGTTQDFTLAADGTMTPATEGGDEDGDEGGENDNDAK